MRVLGIDPGLAQTGWGVIEVHGQRYHPLAYGVVKTTTKDRLEERIFSIAHEIGNLAANYEIERVSIEDIFFAKNVSSAISIAKVIGAIVQQITLAQIPIRLFTPLQIKSAVTGNGTAEKHQVQEMVRILLKLEAIPSPDHAADSLAAAICFAAHNTHNCRLIT